MPPLALTPSRPPTVAAMISTAVTDAPPAGWKPVEVLTKSAPESSAARHAWISVRSPATLSSAADSTMTLSSTPGTAARTVAMSAATAAKSPATAAPTSMTMSTSVAPDSTAAAASCALMTGRCLPDGKPATAAMTRPSGCDPAALCAADTMDGETQTASTPSSAASATSASTSASVASGLSIV